MIRVLIADDHKMVREGLRRILEFDGEIQVIDEADNGEECIKKIRSSKPDIVLLDINMPVMNGIEALQEIRKKKLKTKVIILTVHNEIEYLLRAVDIGIDGYVLKDSDAHELIRAVTSVYEGDKFIQPSLIPLLNSKLIARDLDAERLEQLSKREIEVLKLVAVGMFNKEIGVELGISERTVKNHLSSIFKKIDSSDRTQAAVFAIRNGLVDIK
ncbi:MAG: DNA-binding response regulator [Lachnospiraceae bacterium]|jgi:two-component response regulator (extracellular proteinase response regulator)|nr:MAG: DNA-binding response regulator [Lachnospiraceae bacterium]HCI24791.1 DNA-binding response regulator [Lachnospiraceae bacterium]